VRLTIDQYLLSVAWVARARSTCPRMACGAVVAQEGHVVATGYNGAPHGLPHCLEAGCLMRTVRERPRCCRIKHAEANAIGRAGPRGDTLYTTGQPCLECLKDVLNSPIERVVYWQPYPDEDRDALIRTTLIAYEDGRTMIGAGERRILIDHLDLTPVIKELLHV
jgi:dCMP deaminase